MLFRPGILWDEGMGEEREKKALSPTKWGDIEEKMGGGGILVSLTPKIGRKSGDQGMKMGEEREKTALSPIKQGDKEEKWAKRGRKLPCRP